MGSEAYGQGVRDGGNIDVCRKKQIGESLPKIRRLSCWSTFSPLRLHKMQFLRGQKVENIVGRTGSSALRKAYYAAIDPICKRWSKSYGSTGSLLLYPPAGNEVSETANSQDNVDLAQAKRVEGETQWTQRRYPFLRPTSLASWKTSS